MTLFSTRLKFVLVLSGVSMVVAGLAMLAAGAVFLVEGSQPVELTRVTGPEVPIPAQSTFLGGSVTVYTEAPTSKSPYMLGCDLVQADGELASGTAIGGLAYALGDPVTVDGTTWYPFTEIDVLPEPATLRCAEGDLASVALSQETTFGRTTTFIGVFGLGMGLVAVVLGALALLGGWMIRR